MNLLDGGNLANLNMLERTSMFPSWYQMSKLSLNDRMILIILYKREWTLLDSNGGVECILSDSCG